MVLFNLSILPIAQKLVLLIKFCIYGVIVFFVASFLNITFPSFILSKIFFSKKKLIKIESKAIKKLTSIT
jgi:hypothetical protein